MQATGLERSVRYLHTILRDALGQAVKWQILPLNPAEFVDLPRRNTDSHVRALTEEEVKRFRAAAASSKWAVFFELMLGTGVRPGEALALSWENVDLERGTITIRRSLARANRRWEFNEPKTRSGRRTIPLPESLKLALAQHRERQRELGHVDLLFCNIDGDPVHQRVIVTGSFKPALARAGLSESIRLYDLRHTHATLMLLAEIHPKIVSERLGHSSIAITLDTYSHVLPNMQQEAARKFEELVYGSPAAGSQPISPDTKN
jgi:integrase